MMTSLLSIFDPSSSVVNLNLISPFFLLFLSFYWKTPSVLQQIYFSIKKVISQLFKGEKHNSIIFVSVFFFILFSNLLGLMPFFFSSTSHLFFNLSLSMLLWVASTMWGFLKNFDKNVAHLTPSGCPPILVPFMVMVESVSSLIRPLTLALRLMSNILAGHLILTLISKGIFFFSFFPSSIMFMIHSGFFMFEIGVALIQSYVFSSLMHLYWVESE
nr:ATP synthase subunit 6 [Actornithophilus grandiceps]